MNEEKPTLKEAASIVIWLSILAFTVFCPFYGHSYLAILLSKAVICFCCWMFFRCINTVFVRLQLARFNRYSAATENLVENLKKYIRLITEKCQVLAGLLKEAGLDGDNVEVIYPPPSKKPILPS
ncbi:MAG: hypothetical protein ACYDHY_06990 [Acidiferrobacterales bacterium]